MPENGVREISVLGHKNSRVTISGQMRSVVAIEAKVQLISSLPLSSRREGASLPYVTEDLFH
jgi:hypothetical protein